MGIKQFQKEVERKNKIIDEQNQRILKCQDKIRTIQKKILMNEWYKKFTDKSIVMKEEDRIKGLYQFTSDVILSILVYTFFSRMFDLMLPPVAKHSIVVA